MAAIKSFAAAEIVLGVLTILAAVLWCYVVPHLSLTYLWYTMIGLGALVVIVGIAAAATKTKPGH